MKLVVKFCFVSEKSSSTRAGFASDCGRLQTGVLQRSSKSKEKSEGAPDLLARVTIPSPTPIPTLPTCGKMGKVRIETLSAFPRFHTPRVAFIMTLSIPFQFSVSVSLRRQHTHSLLRATCSQDWTSNFQTTASHSSTKTIYEETIQFKKTIFFSLGKGMSHFL